jgi:predicted ATP-grasp superfamily ATP-dependent carboligase
MLVTELIPGREDAHCSYYTYIDEHGEPLFHFTKRKLRQYPSNFGLGTYHITDWNPEVAEMGLRFFQGIGYRGIGNVEFKRDARDGSLKLIECNARLTLVTEMITLSGIDMGLFIYNRLTGRPLPPVENYRKGLRVLRPIVDIQAFRSSHKRGEMSFWEWLRTLLHRQHFLYFRWSDPVPSLMAVHPFMRRQWVRLKKLFHAG